jgi:hypothetical protein
VTCHESSNGTVGDVVLSSGLAVGAAESKMADFELLQVAVATNTRSDKSRKYLGIWNLAVKLLGFLTA